MVHHKVKDYECDQCDSKFASGNTLAVHIKGVHDKIKDHECPTCVYKACTPGDLRRHMKVCTGAERMSSGEYAIKGVLNSMNVQYQREMRFADCKDIRPLPFDFYLPQHVAAIEFDGQQHFRSVECWGGQERLEQTQRNDAVKTAYCIANNIRLLRIKYSDFERVPELITSFLTV